MLVTQCACMETLVFTPRLAHGCKPSPLVSTRILRQPRPVFGSSSVSPRRCHSRKQIKAEAKSQSEPYRSLDKRQLGLRSEAEAPYRSLRIVLFGFQILSAGVAFVIGSTQLVAALANAPKHLPLQDVAQGLGIDSVGILVFGYLLKRDLDARSKQIARMTREEDLGSLQIELANKKTLRLAQLRQFARIVIVAGTAQQVQDAIEGAEDFKEALQERGVLVVPLPIFADTNTEKDKQMQLTEGDLRWKATALRQGDWESWFKEQMKWANKKPEKGLYISLRMDGRVRGSGVGAPPWERMSVSLPPVSGPNAWSGFMDSFDGRV